MGAGGGMSPAGDSVDGLKQMQKDLQRRMKEIESRIHELEGK
jgi:hypothetical protein